MEGKQVNFLDGSKEEKIKAMKEFFGLSSEQSFQDLDIDEDENDNND